MTTPILTFKKAERSQSKARIAFCAPAGGGKTHSALLLAGGLGTKIAVIDTENGSASLEAGKPNIPEFDVLTLFAPFTIEKYLAAMKAAEAAGYEIIIIDSISHAWAGTGGLLEQVDMKTKASKSQNSYAAWRDITPMHNALVEAILQSKCHIIATMRTKADYVLETNDKGRSAPKKIGLAPIQREGMDYEFTVVFDIDQASHVALASKDRTSMFDGKPFTPTVETGKQIKDWIMSGAVVVEEPVAPAPVPTSAPVAPPAPPVKTREELNVELLALLKKYGMPQKAFCDAYQHDKLEDIADSMIRTAVTVMRKRTDAGEIWRDPSLPTVEVDNDTGLDVPSVPTESPDDESSVDDVVAMLGKPGDAPATKIEDVPGGTVNDAPATPVSKFKEQAGAAMAKTQEALRAEAKN